MLVAQTLCPVAASFTAAPDLRGVAHQHAGRHTCNPMASIFFLCCKLLAYVFLRVLLTWPHSVGVLSHDGLLRQVARCCVTVQQRTCPLHCRRAKAAAKRPSTGPCAATRKPFSQMNIPLPTWTLWLPAVRALHIHAALELFLRFGTCENMRHWTFSSALAFAL